MLAAMQREAASSTALEWLQTPVLLLSDQCRLQWMNPAAEDLFGHSLTRTRGQGLHRLLANPEIFTTLVERSRRRQGSLQELVVELKRTDGESLRATCICSPIPEGFMLEIHPMSQLIGHLEREQAYQKRRLLENFLQGIAHEVNNPLGGMRGAAQLLRRQLDDEQKAYADIIIAEIDRLHALVQRFREKPDMQDKRPANVHELLERVVTLVLAEYPGQVEIQRRYDPSLPDILLFPDPLVQALLNLFRNAVQAGATRIIVETAIDFQTLLPNSSQRHSLRIAIVDNGQGIPEELRDKLFMPMITGRADGTGIGLSLVQEIILQHQGLVQFESSPGHTCFQLNLPMEMPDDT